MPIIDPPPFRPVASAPIDASLVIMATEERQPDLAHIPLEQQAHFPVPLVDPDEHFEERVLLCTCGWWAQSDNVVGLAQAWNDHRKET